MEENLIEEFFGKSDSITKEDLENFLKDTNEFILLEFKEIREPRQTKDLILKSLVGFLNSAEGKGVLIVGVSDDKQIKGVHRDHLDEQRIRNWIRDGIDSVPRAIVAPYFRIVKVKTGDDVYVHLIEVHKKDDVVYFSRESGCAYVRVGDSTKRLNLSESLELVAKKSLAKPYIIFEVEIVHRGDDGIVLALHPELRNIGAKPALYVTIVIAVASNSAIIEAYSRGGITKLSDYTFQLTTGFPPFTAPSYPGVDGTFDNKEIRLKLKKGFNKIFVVVNCYEQEVKSTAIYSLLESDIMSNDKFELSPYKPPIFHPYVTLRHYAP